MNKKINRRAFIKKSTAIGVSTLAGSVFLAGLPGKNHEPAPTGQHNPANTPQEKINIAVVESNDYFKAAVEAVEKLGGMKQFLCKRSRVAILPNVQRNNPGVYTKPEIVRAVIRMCKEAGCQEINCVSWLPLENWENTGLKEVVSSEGANLVLVDRTNETLFSPVPVPKGIALKEARIMQAFLENDVFINLPITKDHAGNKFTGTLKNLMGINSPMNNRTFHRPGWKTDIADITHLDQSIADLNTVVGPDLNIVDATEFVITNGPFGPGKLHKPQKIVAGIDRVAIDAYCCSLWGLQAKDIIMINKAYEHKLGEIDLTKVNIKEYKI